MSDESDNGNGIPPEEDFVPISEKLIESKILSTLTIYPQISYSMLQVGIGTAIAPAMWHPILKRLKEEGRIVELEKASRSPTGRDLTYKILQLAPINGKKSETE